MACRYALSGPMPTCGNGAWSAPDLAKAYDHNTPIPTWPVEVTVVRKFAITQLIPLTGLAAWLPSYMGKVLDKKFGVH